MSTVASIKDAVIVTGEYTNQAGEQKKEYLTVGALFVYNEGGMSLKIKDGITVSGNISFYDRKPKGQTAPQQNQYQQPVQQQAPQQQGQYNAGANNGYGGQQQQNQPNQNHNQGQPVYDQNGQEIPV